MDRTCAAEWYVANPNNLRGVLSVRQSCEQGDPSCDQDDDPETCTFGLSVCLRVPDARLAPACTLGKITAYSIRRPKVRADPVTTGALYSALGTLPGAILDDPRGRDVRFEPALDQTACTPSVAVKVGLSQRLVFRTRTAFASGLVDLDTLRLECVP
jgi:hypothetical protein